jgi:hypothetical protein
MAKLLSSFLNTSFSTFDSNEVVQIIGASVNPILGTNTIGDYIESALAGSGIIITNLSTPEGANHRFAIDSSVVVALTKTQTLTNKTFNLTNNTLIGSVAEFNTALSGDNFVTETATQTITNKTLTAPIIGSSGASFTGAASGAINVLATSVAGSNTITLPAVTGTLVTEANTATLTNKTISGASNTLSNIPNTATTATDANTASAIVARDASGNFSAGTILSTSLTTGSATFGLIDTTATTVNAFGATTTLNLGYDSTAASTTNISTGAVAASTTKTINLGTGGAASSTTNINIGVAAGGTTAIASPTVTVAGVADTATTATHYYVETTGGNIAPKTLANAKTELVTTAAVNSAAATTVGTVTSGTWSGLFGAVSGANLTNLTAGNLSGTIPSGVLGNSSLFIGTTSVALNRTTANLGLTGITSIAMPGSTSGTITVTPTATAGTTSITIPATTGTLVTTGDTGTVTSTMIANNTIVSADFSSATSLTIANSAGTVLKTIYSPST